MVAIGDSIAALSIVLTVPVGVPDDRDPTMVGTAVAVLTTGETSEPGASVIINGNVPRVDPESGVDFWNILSLKK